MTDHALSDASVHRLLQIVDFGLASADAGRAHPALDRAAADGYVANELISAGGVAEVWRGIDTNTEADVAIKVVRRDRLDRSAASATLRHEARMLSVLSGVSGVPRVIRKCDEQETAYLVMEYLEGVTLRDVLDPDVGDETRPIEAWRTLVEIVAAIHDRRVAHGDVKPENVIVGPAGQVTLIDFGFSREVRDHDDTFDLGGRPRGGTARYTPPDGDPRSEATPGADLFALSRIAEEVLEVERSRSGRSSLRCAMRRARTGATARDLASARSRKWPLREAIAACLLLTSMGSAAVFFTSHASSPPSASNPESATFAPVPTVLAPSTRQRVTPSPWSLNDGGEPEAASVSFDRVAAPPKLLPDGRSVWMDVEAVLWVYGVDDAPRRVAELPESPLAMAVDADAERVALALPRGRFAIADLADGQVRHVPTGVLDARQVAWAGRGDALYCCSGERVLWRIDLRTGHAQAVMTADSLAADDTSPGWLAVTRQADASAVLIAPSGDVVAETDLGPLEGVVALGVSPDERAALLGLSSGGLVVIDLTGRRPPRRLALGIDHPILGIDLRSRTRADVAADGIYAVDPASGRVLGEIERSWSGVLTACRWDATTATLFGVTNTGRIQWSGDGTRLVLP